MGRVLSGALLITSFASCSKSLEDKANTLIEKDIKKASYHLETCDPVETQVDSALIPFDDPVLYEKTIQPCKIGMSIDGYDRKMKSAKSSMSIWSRLHQSAYNKDEYQEAKDEYDENAQNKRNAKKKAKKLADELKTILDKEQLFIGFKVRHCSRANNNAGQIVSGEMKYLFDKNMNKIAASCGMDDDEYKTVQIVYKQMSGENVQIEDENFDDDEVLEE